MLLLGINLGHWRSKIIYLLILPLSFLLCMYFRFRRVMTNYWATSMSLGDGLSVLNKGGDGDVK
jgi:hypothetical protein